jgi:hypothetical protein
MSSQPPFRAEFPGLDFVGRGPAPAAKEPFALDEFEAQVKSRYEPATVRAKRGDRRTDPTPSASRPSAWARTRVRRMPSDRGRVKSTDADPIPASDSRSRAGSPVSCQTILAATGASIGIAPPISLASEGPSEVRGANPGASRSRAAHDCRARPSSASPLRTHYGHRVGQPQIAERTGDGGSDESNHVNTVKPGTTLAMRPDATRESAAPPSWRPVWRPHPQASWRARASRVPEIGLLG